MATVTSVDDIRKNLETFHGYLFSENEVERSWAKERLRLGKNLVAGSLEGRVTFGPSRFMGYAKNYLKRHSLQLRANHSNAFHRPHPDGRYTDPAIDCILVNRIRSGQRDWKRFERLHRKLCLSGKNGVEPATKERTYWNLDYDSGFVDLDRSYVEGRRFPAVVIRAERSATARAACIRKHGATCVVCGFNFAAFYGELGKDFIHVHHRDPFAHAQGEREVCPKTDLVPVCPNCHYMLHRKAPPHTPEELRDLMLKTPCSCATPKP